MKRLKNFPGRLLALSSAMSLSAAFAAQTAPAMPTAPAAAPVYQRTTNTESIELSNLPEEGAVPLPTVEDGAAQAGSSSADAKSAGTASAKPAPVKVKKKVLKKVTKADGTEEEVWVDSEEDADSADPAVADSSTKKDEGSATGSTSMNSTGLGGSAPSSWGGGFSGAGHTGGGTADSSSGAGSGTPTTTNGGSNGTGSTSTPTASNGGTAGTGTPVVDPRPGTGSSNAPAPATAALSAKLETYRNAMLNEVVGAQVANPAITRRYQMMNRSTFQGLIGH
jgi:hypothetical protein